MDPNRSKRVLIRVLFCVGLLCFGLADIVSIAKVASEHTSLIIHIAKVASEQMKIIIHAAFKLIVGGALLFFLLGHMERQTSQTIVKELDNLTGAEFEQYVANILRQKGFHEIRMTKASGDYGVDIIAILNGSTYAIQCKRNKSHIGVKAVQEVFAGKQYYQADYAIVISNSDFTTNAKKLAKETGVKLWTLK